jgi:hypothetical protein
MSWRYPDASLPEIGWPAGGGAEVRGPAGGPDGALPGCSVFSTFHFDATPSAT